MTTPSLTPARANPAEWSSEAAMVTDVTPGIQAALYGDGRRVWTQREVGVGRSIADLVCVSLRSPARRLPQAPLSIAESVCLASLRARGPTRIDLLERRSGVARGGLRAGALRRLEEWDLVAFKAGGRVTSAATWTSHFDLVAIEAKLTRWRDALKQAVAYLAYANSAYVALPYYGAAAALQNIAAFSDAGVGLLVIDHQAVDMAIKPRSGVARAHDWRREFVLSRLIQ